SWLPDGANLQKKQSRGTRPRLHVRERLNALEDRGDALTQANTHGGHAERAAILLHHVQQGAGNTRTGTAERVTQSDGAAVQVDLLLHLVEDLEVLQHRQSLRSEGFV